jgi:predicted lipoprotein with Yx(FWY)xxD motif
MRRFARPRPMRPSIPLVLCAAALAALLVPAIAGAGQAGKRVAKQADNATLGHTILTTTKGHTLYSLSAETKGRFICTGACASTWHPLVVQAGVKPTGPVKLSTIERPDGRTQVTFKGRPLYSFSGDSKTGDVNGEGIKDVGTWHAAVIAKATPQPQPQPQPQPEPPYPY